MSIRDKIYKNEAQISEILGENYNSTMNHGMKERDTFKTVLPTVGLYSTEREYITSSMESSLIQRMTESHDKTYFMKKDQFKVFYEELSKSNKIKFDLQKKEGSSNSSPQKTNVKSK